jgi:hypothetical protein
MITYTWSITSLSTVPKVDNRLEVVVLAQWTLIGINELGVQGSLYSIAQFTLTQGQGYTPYKDLTEDEVIGWVKVTLGVEGITNAEAAIQAQITSTLNPSVIPTPQPLPWVV